MIQALKSLFSSATSALECENFEIHVFFENFLHQEVLRNFFDVNAAYWGGYMAEDFF